MDAQEKSSWPSRLARYFLHGITFSLLLFLLELVWVFILVALVIVGFILGLIVAFLLLFFFMGGLNTLLTDWIWSVDIKSDWRTLFVHGIGLFFALLVATLPGYLLILTSPSLAAFVIVFVVYTFIDGFIAKNIAIMWKRDFTGDFSKEEEAPREFPARRYGTEEQQAALSAEAEEVDEEELYDKLLVEYIKNYGVQTGAQVLNNEIKAYTWQGETFAEAVRRVYERRRK